jgi:hypothetical protein
MNVRSAWLALVVGLVATAAQASQPFTPEERGGAPVLSGDERGRFGYLGDNDGYALAFRPDGFQYDRWFSTGTKALFRWAPELAWTAARLGDGAPRWLATVAVNQVIATPRSIAIASADELLGDRPYAGWLALSGALDAVAARAPWLGGSSARCSYAQAGLELYAGVNGPWSLAGWTQSTSHFVSNGFSAKHGQFSPPQGWGRAEVRNGVALDASGFVELPVLAIDAAPPRWLVPAGVRPGVLWSVAGRLDVGTTLDAAALNTTLTAGLLGDPLGRSARTVPFALFVYARAEGRAVAWNRLISGELIEGANGARPEHGVGELSAGLVLRVLDFELHYAQLYRTNEVATLEPGLRTGQLIGQVDLTIVW